MAKRWSLSWLVGAERAQPATSPALRVLLLGLCGVLALVGRDPGQAVPWLLALLATSALVLVTAPRARVQPLALSTDVIIAALAVPATGGSGSPLLPYLLAPAFASGMAFGISGALGTALATALLVSGSRFGGVGDNEPLRDYATGIGQWVVLSLAVGLLAAWAAQLLALSRPSETARYSEVYRLLRELRGLARQLPGSLDQVAVADAILDRAAALAPYSRGAVFAVSEDRFIPVALRGMDRVDFDRAVVESGPVHQAVTDMRPVRILLPSGMRSRRLFVALPLVSEDRCVAVVALQGTDDGPLHEADLAPWVSTSRDLALRFETAAVFDELRRLGTTEERQRLAREIHDGIAQELAFVGYEIDALQSAARSTSLRDGLKKLRGELTRIISELRLSIFDLRLTVDPMQGLGATLGEQVRVVGATAGMTVHLSLTESTARLPADVEAELLRIGQEALANARKHSGAKNIWVTLEVDPPRARLSIADDGTGIADAQDEGFGMSIMKERAARVGGQLRVIGREPVGTCVEIILGEGGAP